MKTISPFKMPRTVSFNFFKQNSTKSKSYHQKMNVCKSLLLVVCSTALAAINVMAQAPNISYTPSTVNFPVGAPISTLTPTNTGGAAVLIPAQVSNYAGTGVSGFVNNNNLSSAQFFRPNGMGIDSEGTIYIAELLNNVIRRISVFGVDHIGNSSGTAGSQDGNYTSTSFDSPNSIAITSGDIIYIADGGNNKIRKITLPSTVTTFAGSGVSGGANGTGTAATFSYPSAIATDAAANVYVADLNNKIRKITPGGVVTDFVGSGTAAITDGIGSAASVSTVLSMTADANYIYFTDGNTIRRITIATRQVTTIAGSGTSGATDGIGTAASFNSPIGLVLSSNGELFIADQSNHKIRKLNIANNDVTTFAGDGTAGYVNGNPASARFVTPDGLVLDNMGNLYVADQGNDRIRKITLPINPYSISPALPAGLSFNVNTGAITGTPTAVTAATVYTVTANNADGSSTFDITLATVASSQITTSVTGLSAFSSCNGTASTAQNFTVSGSGLTSNLVVTAPAGFEVSTNASSGYGGSVSLSPSSGTVASTTIYVRLTNAASGSPSGNITCASTGVTTQNVAVSGTVASISVSAASQTNVSCNGGSNGTASINTPTGGAGGYTYNWTPGNPTGDGTTSVTGLTAGTWTCTVTDANSCTATSTFTITQPSAISTATGSQTNVFCNGGSNGSASVTPSGGDGGYTYSWSPSGGTAATATGLSAGTYTVTVTDANSCTATRNFTITQPTAISVSALSQTNVSCTGGSNGAASINTPTGGAGGYTYNWTPGNPTGDGTTSVTGLTAGTWTCTVTDANSCTATQTFNITATPLPIVSISGTTAICVGLTTSLSPTIGGTWASSNASIATVTNAGVVTGISNGTATFTFTNTTTGCSSLPTATVTVKPIPAAPVITAHGNTTFCAGSNVLIDADSLLNNVWYKNGVLLGTNQMLIYADTTANYSAKQVVNGCSSSMSNIISTTIIIPTVSLGTIANVSTTATSFTLPYINNQDVKSLMIQVSSPNQMPGFGGFYSYPLVASPLIVPIPASAAGTYTFELIARSEAPSHCMTIYPFTLTVVAPPCTPTTGTFTVAACDTYTWAAKGNTVYTASNNTDTIILKNVAGCDSIVTLNLTITPTPATPTISTTTSTTFCAGGSVTLTSSAASGNQWYKDAVLIGSATNATYSATTAGVYTVIATANGCSSAASAGTTVTVNAIPPTPTISTTTSTTFCAGGSVTLTSSAASGNQWYKDAVLIGSATNTTYSATTAGVYTVIATANGCSSAASAGTTVTINTIPSTPTISTTTSTSFCAGDSVTLTSSAASGNQWYKDAVLIGSATNTIYSAKLAGVYTVIATANGCSSAASAGTTVTVKPKPAAPTIAHNNSALRGDTLKVFRTSALNSNTLEWYFKDLTNTIHLVPNQNTDTLKHFNTNTQPANYSLLEVGSNGCKSDSSQYVVVHSKAPPIIISTFCHTDYTHQATNLLDEVVTTVIRDDMGDALGDFLVPTPATELSSTVCFSPSSPFARLSDYVSQRYFQIYPLNNNRLDTVSGRLSLYFTQQEFNDFNASSDIDLPTNPSDATGKANVRIMRKIGLSSDGSGLPGSYAGATDYINPVDADIVWNPGVNYWSISFDVTGFGGFFLTTENAEFLPPGNAITFDGINDKINLPVGLTNDTQSQSVEFWVKINGSIPTGDKKLYVRGEDGFGAGWSNAVFVSSDGKLNLMNCCSAPGNGLISGSTVVVPNRWYHVAAVFNAVNNTQQLYVNGNLEGSNALWSPFRNSTIGYQFGRGNGSEWINESVDEIRVWTKALTQSEIQAGMYDTVASNSPNLAAYYKCDQGTAGGNNTATSTILNSVANTNHAVLSGFAMTGSASNLTESYAMVVPTATAASNATTTSFTATWTAPLRGVVNNGYRVEVSTVSNFATQIAGSPFTVLSGLSNTVTGLTPGTLYYYRVRANKTSVNNQGGYSNTVSVSSVLPLQLLSFTAQKQLNQVVCKWQTTNEINSSHFVLERSTTGNNFNAVGTLQAANAAGNHQYQFADDISSIATKVVYYRLQMVDKDGKTTYSSIRKIDLTGKVTGLSVYPNPIKGNSFTIDLGIALSKPITYSLYNSIGKLVQQGAIISRQQTIYTGNLSAGSYLLRLADGQTITLIK